MFEQEILCHQVPYSLRHGKLPIDNDESSKDKRRQLQHQLEAYESEIQLDEHAYQKQFDAFESEVYKFKFSRQMSQFSVFIGLVKSYIYQHTQQIMRRIRYKESWHHVLLIRQYHRLQSSGTKNTFDVYPQIIVDTPQVPLSRLQLDYLSHNGTVTRRTYS